MARKKADTSMAEQIDWDDTKSFEGYYVGVQHDIPSTYGDFDALLLQDTDGTRMTTVLSLELRRAFEPIEPGTKVWISYKGKEKLGNGNKIKRFEVEYDDEDRIEVPAQAARVAKPPKAEPTVTATDEEPF